jgi:hypothetical protein
VKRLVKDQMTWIRLYEQATVLLDERFLIPLYHWLLKNKLFILLCQSCGLCGGARQGKQREATNRVRCFGKRGKVGIASFGTDICDTVTGHPTDPS